MRPRIITNIPPEPAVVPAIVVSRPQLCLPPPQSAARTNAEGILDINIFVYGTLRKGHGNHRLLESSKFLGERHTRPGFTMFKLGGFPGVIDSGDTSITGELYRVTDRAVLESLDRLEGHPKWYRRTPIVLLEGDQAEIYLYPKNVQLLATPVVVGGDWENLSETRLLGRKERESYDNPEPSLHHA